MTIVGKLHRRKDAVPYGAGSVRHRWLLIGAAGAAQFVAQEILPGTDLHRMYSSFPRRRPTSSRDSIWEGQDVGYHSPRPMYKGMTPMEECDVIEGQCWYDGSGLQAMELCERWAEAGFDDEVIWAALEVCYLYTFCGAGD